MKRTLHHLRIVWAILKKDLLEYRRDRIWMALTILTLSATAAIYWGLPGGVNQTITFGVAGLDDPGALAGLPSGDARGLRPVLFATAEELEAVVAGEADAWSSDGRTVILPRGSGERAPGHFKRVRIDVGVAFSDDFPAATASGRRSQVTVYINASVPGEVRTTMAGIARELALAAAGEELPIAPESPDSLYVVLGNDQVGEPVGPRQSFRPAIIFLVLSMEMYGMSSLIAREIQERTVSAVLVTPATAADLLAAKGIGGTLLGLVQAVVLLAAINALAPEPLLMLTLMLLGAGMVAGTAMIVGAAGRDFMGNLLLGFLVMIPLLVPALAALFPGSVSIWVRLLPSYPLVESLVTVTSQGGGWSDTLLSLWVLLAWCVALFATGWVILRRRVEML